MTEEHAIEAIGLVKEFEETVAVDDVSFAVPRGSVLGLLGPNGAGKTTTVRMMTTLTRPTRGTARVAGEPCEPGPLLFLGDGRDELTLESTPGARVLLIGGEPFADDLVMWWNFVGRDHAQVAQARADWESPTRAERFGTVVGHGDERIPAPELPNIRLTPRRRRPVPPTADGA